MIKSFFIQRPNIEEIVESVQINNEAYSAFHVGDYQTSLTKYRQAIELKTKIHGEDLYQVLSQLIFKILNFKLNIIFLYYRFM